MEITCYRDPEVSRVERYLPAKTYNLAVTLLSHCATPYLFVPIRSMQYMAIIDHDEFVFIDGERKCWIDIAWCDFRRQERNTLDEPVAYQVVFYRDRMPAVMLRLQREFPLALEALAGRSKLEGPARIIHFPAKNQGNTG
ncbi:MAG: hypothetical protein LZF61_11185 [Nitrosomonas sp.]|nr:MAG: hypothetical protein LZF61_11185 [Nitrosomonas sp.]